MFIPGIRSGRWMQSQFCKDHAPHRHAATQTAASLLPTFLRQDTACLAACLRILTSTKWFLRILRMHMSGCVAGTPLSSGLGRFMELARCSPMSSAPKLPDPEPLLLVWRRPTAAAWGGGGNWCRGLAGPPLVLVVVLLCSRLADTSRATICRSSAACTFKHDITSYAEDPVMDRFPTEKESMRCGVNC